MITGVLPAEGDRGPRFLIEGHGDRPFLRMNANAYTGVPPGLIRAEEAAARAFSPAVHQRHISPMWPLEERLARFHRRESAMIFSSAYAAVMGVVTPSSNPTPSS